MKTFPEPHNPENAILDPGYRFIGKDEPLHLLDMTPVADRSGWATFDLTRANGSPINRPAHWTVRRALNVDDPYAPPPEEWSHPAWVIVRPGEADHVGKGWQAWIQRGFLEGCSLGGRWESQPQTTHTIWTNTYYRRPMTLGAVTTVNTSAPESDWFLIKNRPPTDTECQAGMWIVNSGYVSFARWCGSTAFLKSDATHWRPATNIPAPPKPLLIAPKVNGYEMTYVKGNEDVSTTVKFGCAEISLSMLRFANTLMTTNRPGNRTVQSVTLSSGVTLDKGAIKTILHYVEAVNKGASK